MVNVINLKTELFVCLLQELTRLFKRFAKLTGEDVKEQLRSPETCVCLNIIFAFLWREWRDSPQMKRLLVSKLNREFNDLIGAKAAKGIIDEINIRSYSLGESLPIIRGKHVTYSNTVIFVVIISLSFLIKQLLIFDLMFLMLSTVFFQSKSYIPGVSQMD